MVGGCPIVSIVSMHRLLYNLVLSVPLCSGITKVARKGIEPSGLVSSAVNLMALPILFM